jgi:hypothetical protein
MLYLCGVAISWKSKGQKSVKLLSSKARFVALSEGAKDIKFVVQILLSMGIPVKLPVIVKVDNVGAIFMAENVTTSTRRDTSMCAIILLASLWKMDSSRSSL